MEGSGLYSDPAAEAEERDQANYDEERTNITPSRPYYREIRVFTLTGSRSPHQLSRRLPRTRQIDILEGLIWVLPLTLHPPHRPWCFQYWNPAVTLLATRLGSSTPSNIAFDTTLS